MRQVIISIIVTLYMGTATLAQLPTVTATVTTTTDSVIYNYTLINTTPYDIHEFDIFAPGGVSSVITSFTTSQEEWYAGISRATDSFTCITWHWLSGTAGTSIAPGNSADFSLTTFAGVPTTYNYTFPGTNANWFWADSPGGILPVPSPVPEPSSLAALAFGLLPIGVAAIRRRRR